MTEPEWLECDQPMELFDYLEGTLCRRELTATAGGWAAWVVSRIRQTFNRPVSQFQRNPSRCLYLLACEINRLWWRETTDDTEIPPRLVLEERFVEGEVTLAELLAADPERQWWWPKPWHLVSNVLRRGIWIPEHFHLRRAYCDLTRDIFGNPFRPVVAEPSWLTSDVVALARGIYDEKAFDRMPILADALQDAGCANEDMLAHCRGNAPHVRGCWVVDRLLGKG